MRLVSVLLLLGACTTANSPPTRDHARDGAHPIEATTRDRAASDEPDQSEPTCRPVKIHEGPRPRAVASIEGDAIVLRDASPSATQRRWTPRADNPAPLTLATGEPFTERESAELRLALPRVDGEYYVTAEARDQAGRLGQSTALFLVEGGHARLPEPGYRPRWVRDAVVYGVLPRLFGTEGLASVTARLDALAELGVTALWLAPIFSAPPNDYGYAVTDYFTVRPELGGEAALRDLVRAAHARGIRVILDFVPNHTSAEHCYFLDAKARGAASPYHAFYEWQPDGSPSHYFDWTHLPNLEHENPEVERMLTEAALHWVREADVDGFRVDAAWGPAERNPAFFTRWSAELRRVRPDLLLLAEASALDDYWPGAGFDLAYDWTDRPGEWAWQAAFEDRAGEGRALRSALFRSGASRDRLARTARFLANNDTGPRFHDRYGLGIHEAAFTLLLSAPGVPVLFTGDEIAASYEPYTGPPPLDFTDAHGVRERVRSLIALRRALPALRSASAMPVNTGDDPELFGYLRQDESGPSGAKALVLLNFADGPRAIAPALPDAAKAALGAGLRDARTRERFTPGQAIPLAPGQGRILVADEPASTWTRGRGR